MISSIDTSEERRNRIARYPCSNPRRSLDRSVYVLYKKIGRKSLVTGRRFILQRISCPTYQICTRILSRFPWKKSQVRGKSTSSWILEEHKSYKSGLSFKMTKLAYQAYKNCPAAYVRKAVLSASWPRLHPPPTSAFLPAIRISLCTLLAF